MKMHERTLLRLAALSFTFAAGLGLSACDDDETTGSDASTGGGDGGGQNFDAPVNVGDGGGNADAGSDASAELRDCELLADGTECGPGAICLSKICSISRCGDDFIDSNLGEECDDSNDVAGDGCTLCRFDCKDNAACDDANPCNGAEMCNLGTHVCAPGTEAMAGTQCTREGNVAGVCSKGACVAAGCGNGAMDAGEECDDGNADDADGCTRECKFTCKANADCDDKNACTGAETCNTTTHTCVAGAAVVCNANSCAGTCDPGSGMCSYPDVDKDGSSCDKDCADADPARFPGGFECADGKDNDCNTATADVGSPSCECYVDSDKDGFAASTASAIAAAGACPAGYTRTKPVDMTNTDCAAGVASAFPKQPQYFPTSYCKPSVKATFQIIGPVIPIFCLGNWSFDYNCDGFETSSYLDGKLGVASCAGLTQKGCSVGSGWVSTVPACGGKGTYRQCSWSERGGCSGTDIANRPRACH